MGAYMKIVFAILGLLSILLTPALGEAREVKFQCHQAQGAEAVAYSWFRFQTLELGRQFANKRISEARAVQIASNLLVEIQKQSRFHLDASSVILNAQKSSHAQIEVDLMNRTMEQTVPEFSKIAPSLFPPDYRPQHPVDVIDLHQRLRPEYFSEILDFVSRPALKTKLQIPIRLEVAQFRLINLTSLKLSTPEWQKQIPQLAEIAIEKIHFSRANPIAFSKLLKALYFLPIPSEQVILELNEIRRAELAKPESARILDALEIHTTVFQLMTRIQFPTPEFQRWLVQFPVELTDIESFFLHSGHIPTIPWVRDVNIAILKSMNSSADIYIRLAAAQYFIKLGLYQAETLQLLKAMANDPWAADAVKIRVTEILQGFQP
jgi:hypothetical protein